MSKTRYLQISPSTMLEFSFTETDSYVGKDDEMTIYTTKTADGRMAMFFPNTYQFKKSSDNYKYLDASNLKSIATFQNFTVPYYEPKNYKALGSNYVFLDNRLEYLDTAFDELVPTNEKVEEISKYCSPFGTSDTFHRWVLTDQDDIPHYDTMRMYFITGYDFSDVFGTYIKLSLERNSEEGKRDYSKFVDICTLFLTKGGIYKHIQYLAKPEIFGNVIYDRYLDVKFPSVYDLKKGVGGLCALANVNARSSLRITYSDVLEEDCEFKPIEYSFGDTRLYKAKDNKPNCIFVRNQKLSGSIPTSSLVSDKLGNYISISSDVEYLKFYGTWESAPLDSVTVSKFNVSIPLYDTSLVGKTLGDYEIEDDYKVGIPKNQWIGFHEIKTDYIKEGSIYKSEGYSMTQSFDNPSTVAETTEFLFRPAALNKDLLNEISGASIEYKFMFMNINDNVRFVKKATLSLTIEDLKRLCPDISTIDIKDLVPFKIYNKIEESKVTISNTPTGPAKRTIVKYFYDATTIAVNIDGTPITDYTMLIAGTPKNYKFIFQMKDINGIYKNMDLSGGYYKLYAKDANGFDIIIDATYSRNMVLLQGEVEFKLPSSVIRKLQDVPEEKRVMSIVSVSEEGTDSTLYEFKYTFR